MGPLSFRPDDDRDGTARSRTWSRLLRPGFDWGCIVLESEKQDQQPEGNDETRDDAGRGHEARKTEGSECGSRGSATRTIRWVGVVAEICSLTFAGLGGSVVLTDRGHAEESPGAVGTTVISR
jgi:hypothetical protein